MAPLLAAVLLRQCPEAISFESRSVHQHKLLGYCVTGNCRTKGIQLMLYIPRATKSPLARNETSLYKEETSERALFFFFLFFLCFSLECWMKSFFPRSERTFADKTKIANGPLLISWWVCQFRLWCQSKQILSIFANRLSDKVKARAMNKPAALAAHSSKRRNVKTKVQKRNGIHRHTVPGAKGEE